jgi:peptide/nickel transport system permease protein
VIPVLLGVSVLVFGFLHLIPGDPATAMLGERATPERTDAIRRELGLDRPILEQYLLYMGKVVRGDLGVSVVRGDPVLPDILRRFPATVELATAAIVLAVVFGIPIGIASAVWRKSFIDSLSRVWALLGVSMPIFWLGLMLAWVFGVMLKWFPTGFRLEAGTPFESRTNFVIMDAMVQGDGAALRDALRHLVLPSLALATIPLAVIARMTRASMIEVLSRDYIRTAEAKGLRQAAVVLRHGLRNALLPVLTVIGLQVGSLLAGAILTETIFSWPGVGKWLVESGRRRDYPVLQGGVLLIAAAVMAVTLLVDVVYGLVDPRIRHQRSARRR